MNDLQVYISTIPAAVKCLSFLSRGLSLFDWKGKLLNIGLRFVFNHLIDKGKDVITLDTEKNERGAWVRISCRVSPCYATWVDEVLAIVLSDAMLMSVSTDKNVAVELSLDGSKRLHISPGNHLMAMNDTNLEVVDLDHFRLRQTRHFVAVASHYVRLTFCGSQILEPLDRL